MTRADGIDIRPNAFGGASLAVPAGMTPAELSEAFRRMDVERPRDGDGAPPRVHMVDARPCADGTWVFTFMATLAWVE